MSLIVNYILPVFYLLLIAYWLRRHQSFRSNGITTGHVTVFFVAKCVAGILYSYIALKYIPDRGDIWSYYEDGLSLHQTLWHHPADFASQVHDMFSQGGGAVLDSQSGMSKSAFEGIKFLQFLFNLFSFGNLYTNTILFNGIAVFAFLKCWIFLKDKFLSWIPGAWLFLFPSAFFYTAGIHKEGIMFILIALLLPVCDSLAKQRRFRSVFSFVVLMALFAFFKLFVATIFGAAILLYWLMKFFARQRGWVFAIAIVLGITLFFVSGMIFPSHGLPQILAQRQQEFLAMEASSAFKATKLEPDMPGFLNAFPHALYNAFLRPLPGQGGKAMYYAFTLEILFFWAFVLFMFIRNKFRININISSLVWALLVFAVCNLLIIGYTIPNIGATMRYRSIFLPFVGLFTWFLFNGIIRFNLPATSKNNIEQPG